MDQIKIGSIYTAKAHGSKMFWTVLSARGYRFALKKTFKCEWKYPVAKISPYQFLAEGYLVVAISISRGSLLVVKKEMLEKVEKLSCLGD